MDAGIEYALGHDRTVDITTVGRRSGLLRRIEIWCHRQGGKVYITGLPGRRGWYANLLAEPRFVFHLKGGAQVDLAALARPVEDADERRRVIEEAARSVGRGGQVSAWLARSPLIEVELLDEEP